MRSDPFSSSIAHLEPGLSRERLIRLALQRLASGYYRRPEVLRAAAERILRS